MNDAKNDQQRPSEQQRPTLTVRHLNIDLSHGFSRHWMGGNAFISHLFNAQSMSFPIGEQYFIDSVRAALPEITDPQLRSDIKNFIAQEATHRHIHTQYNAQLEKQGLFYWIEPYVAWRIRTAKNLGVKNNLAVTMAYEHFTAIFSDGVLGETQWIADASEPLKTLWTWHSIEETEHKSVVFDAYHAIGGGYLRRISWFVYVTLLFSLDTILQTTHCLYRDGELFKIKTWREAAKFCLGRGGLLRFSLPHYLRYFKPDFQPWQRNNLSLTTEWLNKKQASFRNLTDAQ